MLEELEEDAEAVDVPVADLLLPVMLKPE